MENKDLFGLNKHDLAQIEQHQALDDVVTKNWEQLANELVDVVAADYTRAGIDQHPARQLAYRALMAIGLYGSGRQIYIPKSMARAMRDKSIYDNHNGKNMAELVRRYNLTEQQIYKIIAHQRNLNISLRQTDWVKDQN